MLLFVCNISHADEFFKTEQQNILNQNVRAQNAYNAQIEEQHKQDIIITEQRNMDRIIQEKAVKSKAAIEKRAQDKANALAISINNERLADKARLQKQLDDQLNYIQQKTSQELRQSEASTQYVEALEAAKIKEVDKEAELLRKKSSVDIDVIQSSADTNRIIATGISNNLTSIGNEELFKFLVVIGLIGLILLIGLVIYLLKRKS